MRAALRRTRTRRTRRPFWDKVKNAFDLLQKLLTVSSIVIGAIAVGYLITVGQKQTIVIDKFSIAEDIKKTGYDEPGLARQLADEIATMTHDTTSTKDHRAAYSYDHEPLIQINAAV